MDTRTVGRILRTCRTNIGKTLEKVARELNIGTSVLGMYERGERLPPPDKLAMLADYYEVTVDFLLGRTPDQRSAMNIVADSKAGVDDSNRQIWKPIGGRIRHFRRNQGMSVDGLAQRVGVARQQIVRMEAGLTGAPLPRLKQIADALGISLGDLLDGGDTSETSSTDRMTLSFRDRGLSDEEIRKIMDYIQLLEKARGRDS